MYSNKLVYNSYYLLFVFMFNNGAIRAKKYSKIVIEKGEAAAFPFFIALG